MKVALSIFILLLWAATFATAQKATAYSPFAKIFFENGGGGYCFPGVLFSLDSSVKQNPKEVCGTSMFTAIGYQVRPTFSLSVRIFEQEGNNPNGNWKRTTGNIMADSFNAQASGRTHLENPGVAVIARKEFPFKRFLFIVEGGGNISKGATLSVAFQGTATATDPQSGMSFKTPAADRISKHIPPLIIGGGFHYLLFRGVDVGPIWEWNTGYNKALKPLITMRFYPARIFSKNRY